MGMEGSGPEWGPEAVPWGWAQPTGHELVSQVGELHGLTDAARRRRARRRATSAAPTRWLWGAESPTPCSTMATATSLGADSVISSWASPQALVDDGLSAPTRVLSSQLAPAGRIHKQPWSHRNPKGNQPIRVVQFAVTSLIGTPALRSVVGIRLPASIKLG